MKMRRFIGAAAAMAVAGTLTVGAAAETYNAYIGFQTAPYSFRNSFDDASYHMVRTLQTASTSTA